MGKQAGFLHYSTTLSEPQDEMEGPGFGNGPGWLQSQKCQCDQSCHQLTKSCPWHASVASDCQKKEIAFEQKNLQKERA